MQGRFTFSALLLISCVLLALEVSPYVRSWATEGFWELPVPLSADIYLYLELSDLEKDEEGKATNPWYGTEVPPKALSYDQFWLAPKVFSYCRVLAGGDQATALFLWRILSAALILALAAWLFHLVLPQESQPFLVLGMAALLFIDLTEIKNILLAWLQLPALDEFVRMPLPYARAFFPRLTIPLLFAYVALQMKAFEKERAWPYWTAMVILQGLALIAFPYCTLLMAGITGIAVVTLALFRYEGLRWQAVVLYGAACALLDALYVRSTTSSQSWLQDESYSSLDFDGSQFAHWSGGATFLLFFFSILALANRSEKRLPVRAMLFALGFATLLLNYADAFVSPFFQISHHIAYYVPTALGILLVVLLAHTDTVLLRDRLKGKVRTSAYLVTGMLLLAQIALMAEGDYRRSRKSYRDLSQQARLLQAADARSGDLVIAPAKNVNQASWVPLFTEAEVLYASNAEAMLSQRDLPIHRQRQALYLHLRGWTAARLETVLADPASAKADDWRMLSNTRDRVMEWFAPEQRIRSIREQVLPLLKELESGGELANFFATYDRIAVLDQIEQPLFSEGHLTRFFAFSTETRGDHYRLRWAKPQERSLTEEPSPDAD